MERFTEPGDAAPDGEAPTPRVSDAPELFYTDPSPSVPVAPSPFLPVLVRVPPEAAFDQDQLPRPSRATGLTRRASRSPSLVAPRRKIGWLQWLLSVAIGVALGLGAVGVVALR